MKKNKLIFIIIIILILFIPLTFVACSDREADKVIEISIRENSFKEQYEVDEELNFDNIYILAKKQDGTSEYINVESGMVIGFDTTTTTAGSGSRKLYIEYKGVLSESVSYDVVYSVDNSKEIITKARIGAGKSVKNDILSINLRIYPRGLENINTFLLTFRGDNILNVTADYSNLSFEKPLGWNVNFSVSQDGKSLKLLFYNDKSDNGISDNSDFIINIADGNINDNYKVIDIEMANITDDIVNKYYLPDIVVY